MNRFAVFALLVVFPLRAQDRAGIAGTYELRICSSECGPLDTSLVLVSGYLVLAEHGLDLSSIPLSARYKIRNRASQLTENGRINACFSLVRRKGDLLAGILPEGLTEWTARRDTIDVALFQSPDAGYVLNALISDGRISGAGHEAGYIGTQFENAGGAVIGKRIGPPDLTKCVSASLVNELMATPPPWDAEFHIMEALERRDTETYATDSIAVLAVYGEGAVITDAFGNTFRGVDSVISHRRQLRVRSNGRPTVIRRRDWPRIMTIGDMATTEEYFESVDAASSRGQASAIRRTRRVSVLTREADRWVIYREITLDER